MSGKSYQLVYFNARPRGEHIRLAFHAAGKTFDDKRIQGQEEWKTEKPKAPQGRLPYMIITEGKKEPIIISQSSAILRYVGNELKMNGDDSVDVMQKVYIDEIIETCADLLKDWEKAFFGESDEKKKAENMKKFQDESVPTFYTMLENCVKLHGKDDFAVGNKLSIADCMLYNCVQTCGTDCLDKYKSLKSNREKVEKIPALKKYLKERKDTPF